MAGELLQAALQHHQAGRLDEAEAGYQKLLGSEPHNPDAQHFLGVIAFQRGQFERAVKLIGEALDWQPANAPAQNNLGNALLKLGRGPEAVSAYRQAVGLQPAYIDAHMNLGAALTSLGETEKAVEAYRVALAAAPEGAPVFNFYLGNALGELARHDQAAAAYRAALALHAEFPEALSNLGSALNALGRLDEAATACEQAIKLRPGFAAALSNLGVVRKAQGRLEEATAAFRKAIAAEPGFAKGHLNLGHAMMDASDVDAARACFREALKRSPESADARWASTFSALPAVLALDDPLGPHRQAFARELEELDRWLTPERLPRGFVAVSTIQPFFLAYQEEPNRDLLERYGKLCARIMGDWQRRQGFGKPAAQGRGPIRVGVVSHQFRHHSVWNAIVKGWFQKLDRKRFELHAFHLGSRADHDAETAIAQRAAASFTEDVGGLRQWVEAILARQCDVLIYPEIGMNPLALRLAAMRLAPVQAASWGHPETTGLPTIDFYLSAEDLEPPGAQANYTEKLVALPHLGCCYEPAPMVAPGALPALGGDPDAPLLICPGTPQKYTPRNDALLAGIARRLGRCRLVLFAPRPGGAAAKLRQRLEAVFVREGLRPADFLVFLPWQSPAAFHALMRRAAVFLDTAGFSGFNTAMQAIESGLPVVTQEGRFMRGRLASGILRRMGMQELVIDSAQAYVALAERLVRDAAYAKDVRGRIAASRATLYGDEAPVRGLERFLEEHARR